MLSVIIPVRNAPDLTARCLDSVLFTFSQWQRLPIEFILINDDSDPSLNIIDLFKIFRDMTQSPVHIVNFKQRQNYTGSFCAGLSLAKGDYMFFLSYDMVCTPACIEALVSVSHSDPEIGIIRPVSSYMDSYPERQHSPPFPIRDYHDFLIYSDYVYRYFGISYFQDSLLTADAVLIKKEVIDQIGYFDLCFHGYFSDIDFGLRAQKSGFRVVNAKGAWLFHKGSGYVDFGSSQSDPSTEDHDREKRRSERFVQVQDAYAQFRLKWDPSLPLNYSDLKNDSRKFLKDILDFSKYIHEVDIPLYEPAFSFSSEICEFL